MTNDDPKETHRNGKLLPVSPSLSRHSGRVYSLFSFDWMIDNANTENSSEYWVISR